MSLEKDREIIKKLDKVFKYKLNQEVEVEVFEDIWKKGKILMRYYADYDRQDQTHISLHYNIIIDGMPYSYPESKIKDNK